MPRQHSSGGNAALFNISKRGDVYPRTLLIHDARSAILAAQRKAVNTNVWLAGLLGRRHPNVAALALANKTVRTVWALLANGRDFRPKLGCCATARCIEAADDPHQVEEIKPPIAQAITQ